MQTGHWSCRNTSEGGWTGVNAGKVMVGTALLLITIALIVHPADASGTGAIPLAECE